MTAELPPEPTPFDAVLDQFDRAAGFTSAQKAALAQPLMRSAVKQRVGGGGKKLNYLEGHYVMRTANEIFGYDGWSYETLENRFVCSEVVKKNDREGTAVHYIAHVLVTIGPVRRSDWGYGNATEYGSIGNPHELAAKEAATDAFKRCMRSFGDRFGLVLYDKDRAGGAG